MEMKATVRQLTVLWLIALAAADQALPGCQEKCGSISIPYPFGIGVSSRNRNQKCFLEDAMELTCEKRNSVLLLRRNANVQILNIALGGQVDVLLSVSTVCRNGSLGKAKTEGEVIGLGSPRFSISSKGNEFVSVGCDTYGSLSNYVNGTEFSTGCLTTCGSKESVNGGVCTGVGCCHVAIPGDMKNISFQAFSFNNFESVSGFSKCSYSFVVKNGNYTFSRDHLNGVPFNKTPFVVDWSVGDVACDASTAKRSDYACNRNSHCVGSNTGYGYRCSCKDGFGGNPYHPTGCQDISACAKCSCEQDCVPSAGSFKCVKTKDKSRACPPNKRNRRRKKAGIGVGVGLGVIALSGIYMEYQRRRGMKSKQENFQNNGGDELKDKLSQFGEDPSQSSTIFTEDDLKKATKIWKNNLITGKRGFGRVSKGTLPSKKSVAVKRSRAIDPNRREQFINMVLSLGEVDQENVADFLGCCLETKEPLMVYESVDNGTTLFDYLHNNSEPDSVSWETCLRIAIEVAKALFYLHSRTPKIIHKDVKTSNILLDETLTVKLSGFGDSGLIPLDDTELATFVQESFGYLDPEYMQTRQLTEKSDVYSFGVVLVELLTGEKLFSFDRPEGQHSLIIHFLSCLKGNRLIEVLQTGFRNDKNNLVEIKKVAILAAKCLKLRGEERPSMKVVKMELEKIRPMGKHPLTNKSQNPEEAYNTREPGDRSDLHPWTNENQNFEEAHNTIEHGDTSDQQQFTNENQNFEEAYNTEHDDTGDHQNAGCDTSVIEDDESKM